LRDAQTTALEPASSPWHCRTQGNAHFPGELLRRGLLCPDPDRASGARESRRHPPQPYDVTTCAHSAVVAPSQTARSSARHARPTYASSDSAVLRHAAPRRDQPRSKRPKIPRRARRSGCVTRGTTSGRDLPKDRGAPRGCLRCGHAVVQTAGYGRRPGDRVACTPFPVGDRAIPPEVLPRPGQP
jgi:hypothetical protein